MSIPRISWLNFLVWLLIICGCAATIHKQAPQSEIESDEEYPMVLPGGPSNVEVVRPEQEPTSDAARLYSGNQFRQVIQAYKQIPLDSISGPIAYYVGSSYAMLNDFQAAIQYLKKAVNTNPNHIGYRYQLARILGQSGLLADAEQHYKIILQQDSTFTPALSNYGLLAFELWNYQLSASCFRRALEQNPRDFLSSYFLGSSLIHQGKLDSGTMYLAASISLNPNYVPAINLLAGLYFKKNDFHQALRLYAQANHQRPQDAELWYKMGSCHEKLNQFARAKQCFLHAALLDSSNLYHFSHLAQAYYRLGKYDSSVFAYHQAIIIDKENPRLFFNMGISYANMDSTAQAIQAFERAIKFSQPEQIATIYLQLGALYYNSRQYDRAQYAYRKVLLYDPSNLEAQFFLAYSYDQLDDYSSAIQSYKKYLRMAAGDSSLLQRIQWVKGRLKQLRR